MIYKTKIQQWTRCGGRRRREYKSRRLCPSPSPRSLPTSELPSRSRGSSGGEQEARHWSLFLLRAPRAGSTRQPSSSHLRETPAPEPSAFYFIALVSWHQGIPFSLSRPLQNFSLRALLCLRSPRSVPVLGFRSVLSAALTGCDLKGGGLARDLGPFAPPLCVHPR